MNLLNAQTLSLSARVVPGRLSAAGCMVPGGASAFAGRQVLAHVVAVGDVQEPVLQHGELGPGRVIQVLEDLGDGPVDLVEVEPGLDERLARHLVCGHVGRGCRDRHVSPHGLRYLDEHFDDRFGDHNDMAFQDWQVGLGR